MSDDLGALSHLGESADWLKDAQDASIRDHRLAVREAYRAAWERPDDDARDMGLRQAVGRLLDALRHNHLYPEGMTLGEEPTGEPRYLAGLDAVRKDFERLRDFCVVNRFGIGEIHMLYFVLLLSRMIVQAGDRPYDEMLQEAIGDVVYLRVPIYRADNLSPFSEELQARLHAVRLVRAMQKLGLFDDASRAKLSREEYSDISALLADRLRVPADEYIFPACETPYAVFDAASALEAHARAHAANRAALDDRSPEDLFAVLRQAVRRLQDDPGMTETRARRLQSLAVGGMARAIPHVDVALGKKMYSLLRNGKHMPAVRHGRMFKMLPNDAERLNFLNFLYTNGTQNPVYYVEKFQKYFEGCKLRFVRKEIGFSLERGAGLHDRLHPHSHP